MKTGNQGRFLYPPSYEKWGKEPSLIPSYYFPNRSGRVEAIGPGHVDVENDNIVRGPVVPQRASISSMIAFQSSSE